MKFGNSPEKISELLIEVFLPPKNPDGLLTGAYGMGWRGEGFFLFVGAVSEFGIRKLSKLLS
jgi:hypothetical protein